MSEGAFLLLYGCAFGVPLLIAALFFAVDTFNHNKYLNEKLEKMESDSNENR
jgi:hypothetical protein